MKKRRSLKRERLFFGLASERFFGHPDDGVTELLLRRRGSGLIS
jgi:hypothetical protein